MLRSGSSYLSQSELVLTFGLGAQTKADNVEIQWPSGQVDKLSNVNAGQTVTVEEGKGESQVHVPYGTSPSKSARSDAKNLLAANALYSVFPRVLCV